MSRASVSLDMERSNMGRDWRPFSLSVPADLSLSRQDVADLIAGLGAALTEFDSMADEANAPYVLELTVNGEGTGRFWDAMNGVWADPDDRTSRIEVYDWRQARELAKDMGNEWGVGAVPVRCDDPDKRPFYNR
jgi:hypothetical protein